MRITGTFLSRNVGVLTLVYAILLFAVSVVPIGPSRGNHGTRPLDYSPPLTRRVAVDLAINVAVFIPLGWGVSHTLRRSRSGSPMSVVITAVAVTTFSIIVEIVQHSLPHRYSSLYDVIANGVGAILGALMGSRGRTA